MPDSILLVDDHSVVREGIAWLLSSAPLGAASQPMSVLQCGSAEQALTMLGDHDNIRLVVLDFELPGLSGLPALRNLRRAAPQLPIVMLSAESEPDVIVQCLNSGAQGFVPKTATPEVLRNALSLVLAGGVYVPQEALSRPTRSSPPTPESSLEEVKLTPRQTDVLRHLAQGESNKTIAKNLGMSESTVRVHVAAVLRALNVENRTQAATSAPARALVESSLVR